LQIIENYVDRNPLLDLSRSNLKSLPTEIEYLPHLKYLDLSANSLETLPPHISKLSALHTLNLSQNQLCSLPWQLIHLTSLTRLTLVGNPRLLAAAQAHAVSMAMQNPPPLGNSFHTLQMSQGPLRPEFIEREIDAQKMISQFKEPASKFACARMKLMLVGQVLH
jgi:Leucine rich repeat